MDETKNIIPAKVIEASPEPVGVAEPPVLSREDLLGEQSAIADQVKADLDQVKAKRSTEEQATQALLGELSGQASFVNRLEDTAGIDELEAQLSDISSQIQAENKLAPARLIQAEQDVIGTGVTTAQLGTRLNNRQRDSAINALVLGAQADVAQGRLQAANARIERAVDAKFEPLKAELEIKKFNLDRIDQLVDEGRVDLSNAQKEKLGLQKAQIAKDEDDLEKTQAMQTNILKNQPPKAIRDQLLQATSIDEINKIPGIKEYLMSPAEKLDLQVRKSQLATQALQREKLRFDMTQAEQARIQEELDEADPEEMEIKRDAAQSKLNLLNNILNNESGLKAQTGTTPLTRGVISSPFDFLSGDAQKFKADVSQILSKETLSNLIDVKAQGATFGALSDGERLTVAQAATNLAGFAVYNRRGEFTGRFNASKDDVQAELNRLKENAEKSLARMGGGEAIQTTSSPISIDENGDVIIDDGAPVDDESFWQ
jgi:hypothetical protein